MQVGLVLPQCVSVKYDLQAVALKLWEWDECVLCCVASSGHWWLSWSSLLTCPIISSRSRQWRIY